MMGYFVIQKHFAVPGYRPNGDRLAVVQEAYSYPTMLKWQGLTSISFSASIWNTMLIPKTYLLWNKNAERYYRFQIYKRDRVLCECLIKTFFTSFLFLLPLSLFTKMSDLLWKLLPGSTYSCELCVTFKL